METTKFTKFHQGEEDRRSLVPETLQTVTDLVRPAVLATAVFYGEVRLIDHVGV